MANPFDSIAGILDEYFKLHQLNLQERIADETKRKEILKFVLDRIDAGKSAHEGFKEILPIADDKKFILKLMKELEKMYED